MSCFVFFFLKHPPTTEIYTLSLHDALPILVVIMICPFFGVNFTALLIRFQKICCNRAGSARICAFCAARLRDRDRCLRSEEHTSELQSRGHLVCRLLLEKKNISCSTTTS